MLETGELLALLGQFDAARRVLEDLVGEFSDETDAGVRVAVMAAHVSRGAIQLELGEPDAAVAHYDAALQLGTASEEPRVRSQLVNALLGHAAVLQMTERYHEAALALALTVREFEDDPPAESVTRLASATFLTGLFASMFGDEDEALGVYNLLRRRYGFHRAPAVRELVGRGTINRAHLLGKRGRVPEAIESLAGLLSDLEGEQTLGLRQVRALARAAHGTWLRSIGNRSAAVASYRMLLSEYEADEDGEIADRVSFARAELRELLAPAAQRARRPGPHRADRRDSGCA